MKQKETFLCIDLKSFYASVECVERGLDPFTTNLVVADPDRSVSTICLAITPAMKKLGIRNRCRIHEIPDHIEYIVAKPRMQLYMEYSARIYGIYLNYVAKEDIHVYSVDECFMDVTRYLSLYHLTEKEMAQKLMDAVMEETGITATAGIGTNLYLAKIAMDIVAKHIEDHIGILDEISYREQLWEHKPLSDFWRIGSRTERKLAGYGIQTMGDIALASIQSEDWLYKMFGIDAELLIDHAWGCESCKMSDVRLLLDEFSNIGQIPKFDKLIATIRSREISASIILQSQSQLKTIYKDAAETITGNCDTVLFLGGKESSTLKEISETLGKETIDLYNTSDTRGTSQSYGLNYQKTGKELMSRDELAVMDGNKCILQLRGVRPFLSNKYDITKHKRYKELSDADKRNAFDVEKYLEHKLVFSQDTEFEVYEVNVTEEDVKEAEQNIS